MRLLLLVAVFVGASAETCIRCICLRESGCKPIGVVCDQPGVCAGGYFNIKEPYYIDCGQPGRQPGESTETAWKRCLDDLACSETCVQNYVERYKGMCPGKNDCERMARLHNGGPNGCKTTATNGYWNAIKSCCQCT